MWPRLAHLLVTLAAPLVPRPERAAWRHQWTGDLTHRWRALERAGLGRGRPARAVAARALGAWPHACSRRLQQGRPDMIWQDIRSACRLLLRRPGFSAIAVLTVAFGIGANAVIFSWADALLLNPLGVVPRQDRLVAVTATTPTRDNLSFSYPNFLDVRGQRPPGMRDLGVFSTVAMSWRSGGGSERVWGQLVSGNLFTLLEVRAIAGRLIAETDTRTAGGAPVVVLSHAFWQRRLGGRGDVIGTVLTLNGQPCTVVGIAEPGFRGTLAALGMDVFVPVTMQAVFMPGSRLEARGHGWLEALARLEDGAALGVVQAGLEVVARRLAADHPVENRGRSLRAFPLWRAPNGGQRMLLPVVAVLGGIVSVLLLLVCVNLAGLLLARGVGRGRELAVRLAVGAGRGQLVRQLLVESLLLSLLGGAAGIWLARWSGALLESFMPPLSIPLVVEAGVNPSVLTFGIAVSLAAGLLFGVLPALQASRAQVVTALKQGTGGSAPWRRTRLRQGLVVAQVALALVLLVSGMLFVRSMRHAHDLDPGFAARDGVLAALDLLSSGYGAPRGVALLDRLREDLRAVPGVEDVSFARRAPLTPTDSSDTSMRIDGYVPAAGEEMSFFYNQVGAGYFETIRLPIVAGRAFDTRDRPGSSKVVVVSEAMARRYWPGRAAVGGRVFVRGAWAEVVGVARDAKYSSMSEPLRPFVYLPLEQHYRPDIRLIVRTAGDPAAVVAPVRAAVARVDPNLALFDVTTLREHMAFSLVLFELMASVLGLFGLVAMAMASLGLYGVIALNVSQRTREMGVRLSLGAAASDLRRLVVRQGLGLVLIGLAVGLAAAVALARLVGAQLVGIGPYDSVSYLLPLAVLVVTALGACYLPARRASRTDPVVALRAD